MTTARRFMRAEGPHRDRQAKPLLIVFGLLLLVGGLAGLIAQVTL